MEHYSIREQYLAGIISREKILKESARIIPRLPDGTEVTTKLAYDDGFENSLLHGKPFYMADYPELRKAYIDGAKDAARKRGKLSDDEIARIGTGQPIFQPK